MDNSIKEIDKKWLLNNNKLTRKFEFKNFVLTFDFMTEIAKIAEEIKHHPSWTNTYNKLEITLWTHDQGGLTELDFKLAKRIDSLYSEFSKS